MTDPVVARLRAAGCVFAEDEAALLRSSGGDIEALLARRVAGEPLEYVLGWASFCGLRVIVEPGVFVPRVRTEALALAARAFVRPGSVAVDLCCGSGAVGAVLASAGARVLAVDVDPAAVACARRNVPTALLGDLYDPLPSSLRGHVDVITANAPYVPTRAIALMPPEAREHEHRVALDGGADGLDVQRRVIAVAPQWLAPDGVLLIETSAAQAPATSALFVAAGLTACGRRDDERDATFVLGSRIAP